MGFTWLRLNLYHHIPSRPSHLHRPPIAPEPILWNQSPTACQPTQPITSYPLHLIVDLIACCPTTPINAIIGEYLSLGCPNLTYSRPIYILNQFGPLHAADHNTLYLLIASLANTARRARCCVYGNIQSGAGDRPVLETEHQAVSFYRPLPPPHCPFYTFYRFLRQVALCPAGSLGALPRTSNIGTVLKGRIESAILAHRSPIPRTLARKQPWLN
ncbi:hypothetical protein F4859DRAFT_166858 [Xylaria cf. heliscus]|nr:hypothetical protein F4859DRAFT_166858 [Xylaria cf. heliscus]